MFFFRMFEWLLLKLTEFNQNRCRDLNIFRVNQLTGFYMVETLAFNELTKINETGI